MDIYNHDFVASLKNVLASARPDSLVCHVPLVSIFEHTTRPSQIDLIELRNNFDIELLNQSHFIVQRKNVLFKHPDSFVMPIISVLKCLLLSTDLTVNNHSDQSNVSSVSYLNSYRSTDDSATFDLNLMFDAEIQPVLYVCSILFLFTIIFALIMLFSYRFNRQDAEILESKMILKDWRNFKARGSVTLDQVKRLTKPNDTSTEHKLSLPSSNTISPNMHQNINTNKIVKFKIEDWSHCTAAHPLLNDQHKPLQKRYRQASV